MTNEHGEKYWYNLVTGEVEYGRLSPSVDRAGPYDTADEAAHAMEQIHANTERWQNEEEAER